MWIDTHCHLDAVEFDPDREAVVERARDAGVEMMVLPAVDRDGWDRVRELAHRFGFAYTLGIHPLAVARLQPGDLDRLAREAEQAMSDPRFVGLGEIGLDFLEESPDHARQEEVYRLQLAIAWQLGMPVVLHVRRSADRLLFHLRRSGSNGGIVHAFNGSEVQAQGFLKLGMRLGFGGAATYDGSLRIRRFASELPDEAIVLETDAPDIAPQWMRDGRERPRNEPAELARIAAIIADLRRVTPQELARRARDNSLAALPRLALL